MNVRHMTKSQPLLQLLRGAPWAHGLSEAQLAQVERTTHERAFAAGAVVCARNAPSTHWLGVVEGMVKVDNVAQDGRSTSFIGVTAGGWLGEGSVLKNEPRPYEVVALRPSRIAFMPKATFEWLLARSFAFNRFLIDQLNARLGQFVAQVECDRLYDGRSRVAHCLVQLVNPRLNPSAMRQIEISQEEVGRLCGMSRQITNRALHQLEREGLVGIGYGHLVLQDLQGLQRLAHPQH